MTRFSDPSGPVTVAILGAGGRGWTYGWWIGDHPEQARVVAIADPDPAARERLARRVGLGAEGHVDTWQDFLAGERRADAVLICTQDADHVEPALRALELGYDVLLEKPIAPTFAEVARVADAARTAASENGSIFAVCHVLRYTPYTRLLKGLLDADAIGDIVSVQHLEPVGWWHMAHSFVRGNWRNTAESSFMLLAKSCHDIDWLEYIVGRPTHRVASFGSLQHFRPDQAPEGAAHRCLECPLVETCAYSAMRLYLGPDAAAPDQWPTCTLTNDRTREGVLEALRSGPYGRCVYHCDNDVVDHQVVALEFDGGLSGTFTMTGFTPASDRRTRIFGTQGMIEGDGERVIVHDFRRGGAVETHDLVRPGDMSAAGGHGGGDEGLISAFVAAVAARDQSLVSSDADTSLGSHATVFAAEEARLSGSVVTVPRQAREAVEIPD